MRLSCSRLAARGQAAGNGRGHAGSVLPTNSEVRASARPPNRPSRPDCEIQRRIRGCLRDHPAPGAAVTASVYGRSRPARHGRMKAGHLHRLRGGQPSRPHDDPVDRRREASARALPRVVARTVQKAFGWRCLAFAQNASPRRTDPSATRGRTILRNPNRLTSALRRRRCFVLKRRLSTRSAFTRRRASRAIRSLTVPRLARSTPTAQSSGAALARRPDSYSRRSSR